MINIKKLQSLIIALSGVLLLLTLGFVVYHKHLELQKLNQKAILLRTKLIDLKVDLEKTEKTIDQLKNDQEEFRRTLFAEQDVPAFLDGISNSAAKFNVHVIEIKSQQFSQVVIPKDIERINSQLSKLKAPVNTLTDSMKQDKSSKLSEMLTLASMPIHIKISGSFESLIKFLNSIENYKQLLTVSNVEITSNKTYPQLDCEFNLRIYSLKQLKDIKL